MHQIITSRKVRWMGHVIYIEDMRNTVKILFGTLQRGPHTRVQGTDRRMIFGWIL
jgi:hypothetical protein